MISTFYMALYKLNLLVEHGVEYPEAHTRTVALFEMNEGQATRLTMLYDAAQALGSAD